MGEKKTIILAVILLALVGVYVWYSQKTAPVKPKGKAVDVARIDPDQALLRSLNRAIAVYEKEKGVVPNSLEELKGKYLDPKTVGHAIARKFRYQKADAHSYRLILPKASAPVRLAAKKPAVQKTRPGAGTAPAIRKELITTETGWKYDPRGKPDPFKPFIIARRATGARAKLRLRHHPLTPLQKMPLSEIQRGLKAIVWGAMGNKALVEDATGKGYVIQVGTYVGQNDGIVKKILDDRIVVQEYRRDPIENRLVTNEVVLKLRKGEAQE